MLHTPNGKQEPQGGKFATLTIISATAPTDPPPQRQKAPQTKTFLIPVNLQSTMAAPSKAHRASSVVSWDIEKWIFRQIQSRKTAVLIADYGGLLDMRMYPRIYYRHDVRQSTIENPHEHTD